MFSSLPFSASSFSSLGISSIEGVSLLDAIAIIEAKGVLELAGTASIEGVAILTADGTLTIGGGSAELNAVIDILANATIRSSDANVFIWIAPARATTWTIPVDVGASTWILPS